MLFPTRILQGTPVTDQIEPWVPWVDRQEGGVVVAGVGWVWAGWAAVVVAWCSPGVSYKVFSLRPVWALWRERVGPVLVSDVDEETEARHDLSKKTRRAGKKWNEALTQVIGSQIQIFLK